MPEKPPYRPSTSERSAPGADTVLEVSKGPCPTLSWVEAGGIDVVLFDLGGVLVDVGGVGPMRKLSNVDSDEELWRRWLTCPWVRRFERGHCSAEDFAAGVVAEWDLAVTPEAFLDAFGSWLRGPLPGAAELVSALRRSVTTGCLSNTNAVHWELHFSQWAIVDAFDFRFLSFELGMVKPDRELFDRVAAHLSVSKGRVLFLDDNTLNIEGAADAGFIALQVRGVEETRNALVALDLLDR